MRAALATALALSCRVNRRSTFDRKHYFYHDLPAGYQITQARVPLAVDGELFVPNADWSTEKRVRVRQLHLEHDSARASIDESTGLTLVDLNRSGVGLVEIVTEPDITCGREAARFVKELRALLVAIETCDGDASEGSLRVDANVSVHGSGSLGTVTEIKNVGKPRLLEKAVDYEIRRQVELLEQGKAVQRETRGFDVKRGITVSMRGKGSDAHDYQFMPEPDLPPVVVSESTLEKIRESLPSIPATRRRTLVKDHGILLRDSAWLIDNDAQNYFQKTMNLCPDVDSKFVMKWTKGSLAGLLRKTKSASFETSPVSPRQFASLLRLVLRETITKLTADRVLARMIDGDRNDADVIVERKSWKLIKDRAEIEAMCDVAFHKQDRTPPPRADVSDDSESIERALAHYAGRVQREADGRIHPQTLRQVLLQRLGGARRRPEE